MEADMKKKIILIIVLVAVFIASFVGASYFFKEKPKGFGDNEFSITLPDKFSLEELEGARVYLESDDALIIAYKDTFQELEALGITKDSSLNDYLELIIKNNNYEYEVKEDDGLVYFEYEEDVDDSNYYYFVLALKSDDAFWLVNFACLAQDKDEFKLDFMDWAKTIEV